MRAVLEPACPVSFMVWLGPVLPVWVGPPDLMAAPGSHDIPAWEVRGLVEAVHRRATVIAAVPDELALAAASVGPLTTHLPTPPDDPMAMVVVAPALLGQLKLGPKADVEPAASAADTVAVRCSPVRPPGDNPGKDLAVGLADSFPLVWGGTTLAGYASRRTAETLQRASGRLALAADAEGLEVVLLDTPRRDALAGPFERDVEIGPALPLFDAGQVPEPMTETARRLACLVDRVGVWVCHISSGMAELGTPDVERYITLLLQGRYATTYLGIGLGLAQG